MSVRHVMENAEALDGQEIIISGWIEDCQPLSCSLWASSREPRGGGLHYQLSIASSRWFDAFARRKAPTYVTLRARLNAECVTDPASGTIALCADRAESLVPLAIIR